MSDEAYKPDLLTQAVTSDAATKVASGTEALYRGLFPKGAMNALEVGLGGAKQEDIDARAAKLGKAGQFLEAGGALARDTSAMALAGPAGLYGIAALNTIGDTAQNAVNHSADLTVEHTAATLFKEMLGAAAGNAVGAAIPAIGGRVADTAGKIVTAGGRKLMSLAEGGITRQMVNAGVSLEDSAMVKAARTALDSGVFGKARKAALEFLGDNKAEYKEAIADMIKPFDDTIVPAPAGKWQQVFTDTIKPLRAKFESQTGTSLENLTPSKALAVEEWLGKQAKEAGVTDKNWLLGLQDRIKPVTDQFHAEIGLPPQELRGLQSQITATEAAEAMVPKGVGGSLSTAAKSTLSKAPELAKSAALAGAGEVGDFMGLPTSMIGLTAGGLHAGKVLAPVMKGLKSDLMSTAKVGVANLENKVGQSMANFDRTYFSQMWANKLGSDYGQSTLKALQGIASEATGFILDDHKMANLQGMAQDPNVFLQHAQDAVQHAPIPDEQKPAVVQAMATALQTVQPDMPKTDHFSPPGARGLTANGRRNLEAKLSVITDPEHVLRRPTRNNLETLQKVHPQTHSTLIQEITRNAGGNIPSTGAARRLLDAIGFDKTMKDTGRQAQKIYATPPPQPQSKSGKRRASGGGTTINNDYSTSQNEVEREN